MNSDYFNTSQKRIKVKAQGYKSSNEFDITTTGISGKLELALNKTEDVTVNKFK